MTASIPLAPRNNNKNEQNNNYKRNWRINRKI